MYGTFLDQQVIKFSAGKAASEIKEFFSREKAPEMLKFKELDTVEKVFGKLEQYQLL